jgi:uncharacterized protein (DUF697 family)
MKEKKEVNSGGEQKDFREEKVEAQPKSPTKIVNQYALGAMAAGLVPMPYLDLGAVAAVQLKMLHRLSKQYDVPFSENSGKSIIATLLGTATYESLGRGLLARTIKMIPILGYIGMLSMPIFASTTTYAMGKLFIQHFESGGTMLNFDPHKAKESFLDLFKKSKGTAYKLKKQPETA